MNNILHVSGEIMYSIVFISHFIVNMAEKKKKSQVLPLSLPLPEYPLNTLRGTSLAARGLGWGTCLCLKHNLTMKGAILHNNTFTFALSRVC